LLAAGVVAGVGIASLHRHGSAVGATPTATGTATVRRTTLEQSVTLDGRLDHGPELSLTVKLAGTVTWLPAPGSTLRRGDVVARVNDQPVVLLYGALPSYRALGAAGVERAAGSPGIGRDVQQLEENLRALGESGFVVDEVFTAATTRAVRRWQTATGRAPSGTVAPGDVVYAGGPIRVSGTSVAVGSPAPADVLTYTNTEQLVEVRAPVGATSWAVPRVGVQIVLPSGATVRGVVRSVSASVSTPSGGEGALPGVDVVVAIVDKRPVVDLERATVTVRYVAKTRRNVLAVPVTALIALAEGGYGLELADEESGAFVAVQTGMFAGGEVEVSGDGITAGLQVRVPR
jgi:peptidoglycan hydrolase-like protein with peptidoglycan-binding domain